MIIAGKNEDKWFERDCALAATYFMFAFTARGLGTCWIGFGENIEDADLKKEIGLPQDCEIAAILVVGYPKIFPTKVSANLKF